MCRTIHRGQNVKPSLPHIPLAGRACISKIKTNNQRARQSFIPVQSIVVLELVGCSGEYCSTDLWSQFYSKHKLLHQDCFNYFKFWQIFVPFLPSEQWTSEIFPVRWLMDQPGRVVLLWFQQCSPALPLPALDIMSAMKEASGRSISMCIQGCTSQPNLFLV